MNAGLKTFYANILGKFVTLCGIKINDNGNIVALMTAEFGVMMFVDDNILNVPCKEIVLKIYTSGKDYFIDFDSQRGWWL